MKVYFLENKKLLKICHFLLRAKIYLPKVYNCPGVFFYSQHGSDVSEYQFCSSLIKKLAGVTIYTYLTTFWDNGTNILAFPILQIKEFSIGKNTYYLGLFNK